ncbi:hypothetical protein TWF694_006195 [Orbilia ellipsospora]|uniref:Uncharacterized protein n=1 Tax=Orbilia ellipsospora TaxID=2528407 RepID=A0AAV9XKV4_9PEZI
MKMQFSLRNTAFGLITALLLATNVESAARVTTKTATKIACQGLQKAVGTDCFNILCDPYGELKDIGAGLVSRLVDIFNPKSQLHGFDERMLDAARFAVSKIPSCIRNALPPMPTSVPKQRPVGNRLVQCPLSGNLDGYTLATRPGTVQTACDDSFVSESPFDKNHFRPGNIFKGKPIFLPPSNKNPYLGGCEWHRKDTGPSCLQVNPRRKGKPCMCYH